MSLSVSVFRSCEVPGGLGQGPAFPVVLSDNFSFQVLHSAWGFLVVVEWNAVDFNFGPDFILPRCDFSWGCCCDLALDGLSMGFKVFC